MRVITLSVLVGVSEGDDVEGGADFCEDEGDVEIERRATVFFDFVGPERFI